MKYLKILLLVIILMLLIIGFVYNNGKLNSNEIIPQEQSITLVQVDYGDLGKQEVSKQTMDKKTISALVENISNIKLVKLNKKSEESILKKRKLLYLISLNTENVPSCEIMIFSPSDIMFIDLLNQKKGRTSSYIHYNLDNIKLNNIISNLESSNYESY